MSKFIYTFSEKAKESLLSKGFIMLKEDIQNSMCVFENKDELRFDLSTEEFAYSNILTF